MKFKQKITWLTVVKILVLFLTTSFFVSLTLIGSIEQGQSIIACWFAAVAYLAVCLAAIAARLGDFDNDLHTGDSWYNRPSASRSQLFFDPDP